MVAVDASKLVAQMRKGTLEFCVLALLETEPHYGFSIVRSLGETNGLGIGSGTVYPLLTRLRRDGLVTTRWAESDEGPPRRYYQLSRQGSMALDNFRQQWLIFRTDVDNLLGLGGEHVQTKH